MSIIIWRLYAKKIRVKDFPFLTSPWSLVRFLPCCQVCGSLMSECYIRHLEWVKYVWRIIRSSHSFNGKLRSLIVFWLFNYLFLFSLHQNFPRYRVQYIKGTSLVSLDREGNKNTIHTNFYFLNISFHFFLVFLF